MGSTSWRPCKRARVTVRGDCVSTLRCRRVAVPAAVTVYPLCCSIAHDALASVVCLCACVWTADIYQRAAHILTAYFGGEEEEDGDAPAVEGFGFNANANANANNANANANGLQPLNANPFSF
jgi:hypothetical protein